MSFTFLKTGAESAKLAERAAKEQELRRAEQGKAFRFWMKEKEEARITFVDGDLGPNGFLEPPRFYEHNLHLDGSWNNFFACPEKTDPGANDKCPICESGDRPALVALFTIIDHRQGLSKDKSKTYKDTKKLLVAKPQTFEMLNKIAMKRGGLTGCTFDASRVGDKSAAVGSLFEFVEKQDPKELRKIYMIERVDPKTNLKIKSTNFTPLDYEKEITHRTGDELRALLENKHKQKEADSDIPSEKATGAVDYSKEL